MGGVVFCLSACVSAGGQGGVAIHIAAGMSKASLVVHAAETSKYPVPRYITGKFCEHLYFNVTNGMEAQILKNPTFGDYPFSTGQMSPDGLATFHYEPEQIARAIRGDAGRWGWPQGEVGEPGHLANAGAWHAGGPSSGRSRPARTPGLAGGRAQRVAAREPGQGIMQWTWLPLHRVRKFEVTLWVRSPNVDSLTVSLMGPDGQTCAKAAISPVTAEWRRFDGSLEVPAGLPDDKAYRLAVTADKPGQFVIDTMLLYPADHVNHADPDVIRLPEGVAAADPALARRQLRQQVSLA